MKPARTGAKVMATQTAQEQVYREAGQRSLQSAEGTMQTKPTRNKQGGQDALPWKRTLAILESSFTAEAGIERTLVTRVRVALTAEGPVPVGFKKSHCRRRTWLSLLIDSQLRALVADGFEQVSNQTQVLPSEMRMDSPSVLSTLPKFEVRPSEPPRRRSS